MLLQFLSLLQTFVFINKIPRKKGKCNSTVLKPLTNARIMDLVGSKLLSFEVKSNIIIKIANNLDLYKSLIIQYLP